MGDTKDDKGHTQQITGSITAFYIGETQPRGELPQRLRERLYERKIVNSKESLIEREKAREKRLQDIREKKLQKLREHHEKVKRLAEEKKLRKLQEKEQGQEEEEQVKENNEMINNEKCLSRNSNYLNDYYYTSEDMNELKIKSNLRYYSYADKENAKRQYG
ncbi:unnamed protein product [Trichobilharzia regenti]|uniref:Uncharacterized protein n=1 Tax=Trichobilharzia regenti TaxID=157069 RepID=A0A183W7G2_TRIRE|nr:unnamed protein product [Trichobilharzia regenti]VDQ03992.1 unnamed protein product [Trichobilharzia regenti]